MTFLIWVVLFALAIATDKIIAKHWGKSGLKIATLLIAVISLASGVFKRDVWDTAFGVFMLWSARPTTTKAVI